jgi:hypothetical protein
MHSLPEVALECSPRKRDHVLCPVGHLDEQRQDLVEERIRIEVLAVVLEQVAGDRLALIDCRPVEALERLEEVRAVVVVIERPRSLGGRGERPRMM